MVCNVAYKNQFLFLCELAFLRLRFCGYADKNVHKLITLNMISSNLLRSPASYFVNYYFNITEYSLFNVLEPNVIFHFISENITNM